MAEDYSAWLLLQEPPNDDLTNLLTRQLGVFAQLDLTARPLVSLGYRDGRGVLATSDPDSLFDLIWEKHQEKKNLLGFSAAPLADLIALDGQTFFSEARYISVSCAQSTGGGFSEPYFRRFVELKYETASLHGGLTAPSMVQKVDPPSEYPLILNPQPVRMSRNQLETVFGYDALALRSINAVVLPPTRSAQADSYLARRYRDMRGAWAKAVKIIEPRSDEPAMVSLWRLVDDPLVTDLLLDGGSIRLWGEDREPTGTEIGMCTSLGSASSYRARAFLSPEGIGGPPWASYVFRALQADLESAVPGGIRLASGSGTLDWGCYPLRPWQPGGAPTGSWDHFQRVKEGLEDSANHERALVEEEVLNPSRRRAFSTDLNNQPDHDLCERAFISRFWRCPWSSATDSGPWREALVELLLCDWNGAELSAAQRVESWSTGRWLRLQTSGEPWIMEHPATVDARELQKWRLLLPLGVVFQTHGRVILNQISQLDRGYVLA